MLKVREVITFKDWVDGSGWSYTQTYSDKIIEITDGDLKSINWDWYDTDSNNPPTEGYDTKIIVALYAEDADISEDEPLASFEKWHSKIWTERHAERRRKPAVMRSRKAAVTSPGEGREIRICANLGTAYIFTVTNLLSKTNKEFMLKVICTFSQHSQMLDILSTKCIQDVISVNL